MYSHTFLCQLIGKLREMTLLCSGTAHGQPPMLPPIHRRAKTPMFANTGSIFLVGQFISPPLDQRACKEKDGTKGKGGEMYLLLMTFLGSPAGGQHQRATGDGILRIKAKNTVLEPEILGDLDAVATKS